MKYMRQFYITFPIRPTVSAQLSYSHLKEILPIKNESKSSKIDKLNILLSGE